MTRTHFLGHLGIVVAAAGLIGCGAGMTGNSAGGNRDLTTITDLGGSGSEPTVDMDKIETQAALAEEAMAEAEAALEDALAIGSFGANGGSLSIQSFTGIAERLEDLLNKLFDKITIPAQKAKEYIQVARAQLVAAMAKLDPNNPAQAALLARLQEAMKKLDELEARVGSMYKLLADKIDLVTQQLDNLIAKLDSGNPLMMILVNELKEIRDVIVAFQQRLASL